MKILLVCCAGMSTSMLVQRMDKAAKAKGIDVSNNRCSSNSWSRKSY